MHQPCETDDEELFFRYHEDDQGGVVHTNLTDDEVTELLAQYIQRSGQITVH